MRLATFFARPNLMSHFATSSLQTPVRFAHGIERGINS